jgi:hypothetical protein
MDLCFASPVWEDACSHASGTVMPHQARMLLILVVATLLMAGCGAPSGSDQASADANAPPKSINSNTPALITFTDASGQPWNLYLPQARPRTIYLQAPATIAR